MSDTTKRPSTAGVVVWRLPTAIRVLAIIGSAALPLLVLYGVSQSPDQLFGWLALAALIIVAVVNAGIGRRSCILDQRQLRAKGRFTSRTIELNDLRQVAIGLGQHIWVQTHHPLDHRGGTVLCLRMIPTSNATISGHPVGAQAAELIRNRATSAGAQLDPPLTSPQRAPSRKPLIFSI